MTKRQMIELLKEGYSLTERFGNITASKENCHTITVVDGEEFPEFYVKNEMIANIENAKILSKSKGGDE